MTTDASSAGAASCPPGARVGWNDWTGIPVPALGSWVPDRSLSVVVVCGDSLTAPDATLRGLSVQTYPRALLEVVLVVNGERPPTVPDWGQQLPIESVSAVGRGPGALRNLGVERASGEILVFLAAGVVPERQHLEAHARWHHAVANAVSLGSQRLAELGGCDGETMLAALRSGGMAQLLGGRVRGGLPWMEDIMGRTAELTSAHSWLWQAVDATDLGIRRELLTEVGGFDQPDDAPEAGDGEFGFRVLQSGALLVPERSAIGWRQISAESRGHADRGVSIEVQARLRHRIADPSLRMSSPGRSFSVPMVMIDLRLRTTDRRADIIGAVEAILASTKHDLVVRLPVSAELPDRAWMAEEWRGDPRVLVGVHDGNPAVRFAPVRVATTTSARFGPDTVRLILDRLADEQIGALHISVPWHSSYEMIEAWLTRAEHRARWATDGADDTARTLAQLFGERWETGLEFGLESSRLDTPLGLLTPALRKEARRLALEPARSRPGSRRTGRMGVDQTPTAAGRKGAGTTRVAKSGRRSGMETPEPACPEGEAAVVSALDGWLATEQRLARLRSRRSVQLADAWAGVKRSRGPRALGSSLGRLAKAFFHPRVVAPPTRDDLERRSQGTRDAARGLPVQWRGTGVEPGGREDPAAVPRKGRGHRAGH